MAVYSRYKSFTKDGSIGVIPFIKVPENMTDLFTYYKVGETRMDLLSYQYYDDPNYGWLILQANPHVGFYEFNIEDGAKLRIPYPLETAIQGYEDEINRYKKLNG